MPEGPKELTRPKSAGKVFFFARSPEAPRTMMTVFSLSSMELMMALLATYGAARDSLQIMKSGGKVRGRWVVDQNGGNCLPRPFGLVPMNDCISHLGCFPILIPEKE